jgi:hypothetical protein
MYSPIDDVSNSNFATEPSNERSPAHPVSAPSPPYHSEVPVIAKFAAIALLLTIVAFVRVPVSADAPAAACTLTTAAAVSAAVGQPVTTMTTGLSPRSLCSFSHFPTDPHESTQSAEPQLRMVNIGLFNSTTINDPKIGGVVGQFGCRQTLAQCEKALTDRSPRELYAAQPHGPATCSQTATCLVTDQGVVWAMQGSDVIAIVVVAGTSPNSAMALAILKSIGTNF